MSHIASHLAAFDSDPVLAGVQENLSPGGSGISAIALAGSAPVSAGGEIMNALIGLAVSGSRTHAPMAASISRPSSVGPALGAGVAGLAAGAALTGALIGKGKPVAAAVPAGIPPAPPTETPAAKPAAGAVAPTGAPTPHPGGSKSVSVPPTKAPIDPKKYSGFEQPELGKGTQVVLGAGTVAAKPGTPPPLSTPPATGSSLGQEFSPGGLTLAPLAPPPKDLALPS